MQAEYKMIIEEIVKPNGLDESAYTFEVFEWAMSMLFSRAIDLREVGQLAPCRTPIYSTTRRTPRRTFSTSRCLYRPARGLPVRRPRLREE